MKRAQNFRAHSVLREDRADGTILLRSAYPLGPYADRTVDWLVRWATETPNRVFLAERSGAGWRTLTYGAALDQVRTLAGALLDMGLNADRPVMILSGNGVDHGVLVLAGQYAGIPIVPVAEQYALIHGAHGRLRHAIELIRPAAVYVSDAAQFGEALDLDALTGIDVIASHPNGRAGVIAFDDLLRTGRGTTADAALARVTPETVAKILLTSGSTSAPKGVLTTHQMLCSNQAMIAQSLPFVAETPPVIVDWLPWNHVFGGSHNFNLVLSNGGTLYIDDGKPVKGLFERTIENLSMQPSTLCFNVPVGFAMLLEALKADAGFRRTFFADLDMIFYAGASLPQDVWRGLEEMAMQERGEVPLMTSSWGLTETAPAALTQQEPADRSGIVGVPVPGVTVKLIPDADCRCEIRVKGPSITQGYFADPEKTAEAFDEEGFFITGDAMRFLEPDDMDRGLRFDGRISEDFKLLSGTWVRAAQLRLDMLACLGPLVADLVITGADRAEIGVMVFPNLARLKADGYSDAAQDGALVDPHVLGEIHRRLVEHDRTVSGSASRVVRAIVLAEPPSMADSEVTAKGNLNFNAILARRRDVLERLYDDRDPAVTRI